MKKIIDKIIKKIKEVFKKETLKESLSKFLILSGVLLVYFVILSSRFGMQNGFLIMALTWSFFVFCTPIADAGFLLDFPLRVFLKIKMIYSEIAVWIIAFLLNIFSLIFYPEVYSKTFILNLFHHIISQPFPYWGIILLSGAGTFLSIIFGDEVFDVIRHSQRKHFHKHNFKYQIILMVGIIVLIIILYDFLLKKWGINIHL